MPTAKTLMSLGVASEVAIRTGFQEVNVTLTANTQGSAGGLLRGPGKKIVNVTPGTNGFALTLPAQSEVGDEVMINNVTANTFIMFPPVGGNLNGETTDASMAFAAQGASNGGGRALKVSALRWIVTLQTVT